VSDSDHVVWTQENIGLAIGNLVALEMCSFRDNEKPVAINLDFRDWPPFKASSIANGCSPNITFRLAISCAVGSVSQIQANALPSVSKG
jgi:hypothetical protein